MTHRRSVTRSLSACTTLLVAAALLSGCSSVEEQAAQQSAAAPSSNQAATESAQSTPSPTAEEPTAFSLMVTGDVLLHPQLLDEAQRAAQAKSGNGKDFDFQPLLAGLKPFVQDADVAICNMETPIGTPPYSGYPIFTVPSQITTDLAEIGYDGCTTATNHTMDAGSKGVVRTLDSLQENGLFTTGSYRSKKESQQQPILEVDGVKLGVIASTYSLNGMKADASWRVDTGVNAERLVSRAKSARKAGAEVVVAAIHDGAEYTTRPTDSQRKFAHDLVDSGAFDFIYMHHTHSVLPIEKYKGTWIVYGLGNSVAKHATPTILNREGISVKASFRKDGNNWSVSELEYVPHQLSNAPVTWCQVATTDSCVPTVDAKASLKRTEKTLNAYGAFDDGLEEWKLN